MGKLSFAMYTSFYIVMGNAVIITIIITIIITEGHFHILKIIFAVNFYA